MIKYKATLGYGLNALLKFWVGVGYYLKYYTVRL